MRDEEIELWREMDNMNGWKNRGCNKGGGFLKWWEKTIDFRANHALTTGFQWEKMCASALKIDPKWENKLTSRLCDRHEKP